MKNILITGGAGFIGKRVANSLNILGYNPIVFDKNKKLQNQDQILGDVRDFTSINEAVGISDGVIHLAGVLGTSETINEPGPSIDVNIIGGLNIFKACKNHNKPCTYISVGNYWMNNSYSITKDTAERFAWMFNREHGTKIAVVRALNAYGPGQKHSPVRKIIPNFVIPALRNDELIVYGDGLQIMDMIFVDDLADILVRALVTDHNQYIYNPNIDTKPPKFDAGTGIRTTVQEIAQTVIDIVGKGHIKNVPMRAGEPEHSVVVGNPETLRPLYNGNFPILKSLRDGLENTIPYYQEYIKNA
jgi:nucleoside-diphosphate-sugar epimerase